MDKTDILILTCLSCVPGLLIVLYGLLTNQTMTALGALIGIAIILAIGLVACLVIRHGY